MSSASQFFGGGSAPLGGYGLFSVNNGNVITQTDGKVFLKSGVIAPAASYPTVPSNFTDYLNPPALVSTIGSGGRWCSIAIDPQTGFPMIMSDSGMGQSVEMRGKDTASSTDCSVTSYGQVVTANEMKGLKWQRHIWYKENLVATSDASLGYNNGLGRVYSSKLRSDLYTNYAGVPTTGFNTGAIAANPGGNLVMLRSLGLAGATTSNQACYIASLGGSTTASTLPSTALWAACDWGSSTFVAVASGGTAAATSADDGLTWTARTLPAAASWSAVAFGPASTFVAVASGGTAAAYTTNSGTAWTAATLPATANWSAVCYSSTLGMWCAVSSGSAIAATSTNLTTWTQRTLPASADWADVKWSPALACFVAVARDGKAGAAISTDGITWAAKPLPNLILFNRMMAGGGTTLYATDNAEMRPTFAKSTDSGATWTYYVPSTIIGGNNTATDTGFRYLGGKIVAAVSISGNTSHLCLTSTDGINWTSTSFTTPSNADYFTDIAWNGTNYLLTINTYAGVNHLTCLTSPDAVTWTLRTTLSTASYWKCCTALGTVFVAYGLSTNGIARSTDNGLTWTNISISASYSNCSLDYDSVRGIGVLIGGSSENSSYCTFDQGLTWQLTGSGYFAGFVYGYFLFGAWINGGSGVYSGYTYNSAWRSKSPAIGGGNNVIGMTGYSSYTHGYSMAVNRAGYNARSGYANPNYVVALPQLQSGINYYLSSNNELLKMDTQLYIDNTQIAAETAAVNVTARTAQYYMRVK